MESSHIDVVFYTNQTSAFIEVAIASGYTFETHVTLRYLIAKIAHDQSIEINECPAGEYIVYDFFVIHSLNFDEVIGRLIKICDILDMLRIEYSREIEIFETKCMTH